MKNIRLIFTIDVPDGLTCEGCCWLDDKEQDFSPAKNGYCHRKEKRLDSKNMKLDFCIRECAKRAENEEDRKFFINYLTLKNI